ncbi:MAG: class I poly(R)-hydroxyalkanoic acid synthase [Alphaproteobacteria bacterium]|nr:class I poly(R)-hydroxyalkanoic acid synthase [Alphaproteobacteria bacterium]
MTQAEDATPARTKRTSKTSDAADGPAAPANGPPAPKGPAKSPKRSRAAPSIGNPARQPAKASAAKASAKSTKAKMTSKTSDETPQTPSPKKPAATKAPTTKRAAKKVKVRKTAAKKANASEAKASKRTSRAPSSAATAVAARHAGAGIASKKATAPTSSFGDARRHAVAPAPDSDKHESIIEDFDALASYLADVSGKSQDVIAEFFGKNREIIELAQGRRPADPLNIGEAYKEMLEGFASDPATVLQRQFELWGDYAKLIANTTRRFSGEPPRPAIEPASGDKRFRHKAWSENYVLDFIKQSYLITSKWLTSTVEQLDISDEHEKKRAEFFTRQFVDALAPTNFPMLNPEVVEATIESRGENLMKGIRNFLEDIDRGHGDLAIRQADLDYFKLGENIATTPGKVVFQNEIMQLIQYDPTTEKVARRPLLIFPPWINKFYILDLQPSNSFIKWMVDQGRTVFVVSWVNPGPELAHKTFEDYIEQGCFEALTAVGKATGERDVDAIGYCIGGTMLATALGVMARKGDDRIRTATFLTAQADFSAAGDLLLFVDDAQLDSIERQMDAAGGVLEGRAMATTFNMLRSNDLIWQFVIDNYMMGKDPARFDLLFWNSDSTRMPKNVHLYYLREFYQKNALAKGELVINGERLDLQKVAIPMFFQAGETDHIAPHQSVYNTARLFADGAAKGKIVYMLAGSGHIAGVINHPDKNKYHHSVSRALPATLDEWKADAERRPGSWWRYWMDWLDDVSPGRTGARTPGDGDLAPIEDAPGAYVKVQS